MSAVRLFPEAVAEVAEAAEWYAGKRPGLEAEFLAEVERTLPLIGTSPTSFSRLLDLPADLGIRLALLPRFPYALIFMDLGTEVEILAPPQGPRGGSRCTSLNSIGQGLTVSLPQDS